MHNSSLFYCNFMKTIVLFTGVRRGQAILAPKSSAHLYKVLPSIINTNTNKARRTKTIIGSLSILHKLLKPGLSMSMILCKSEASKALSSTSCEFKIPASVQAILFWYVEMLHSHCLHPVDHIRNQFRQWRLWKEHYHEPFGKDSRLAFHFHPSILKQGLMKKYWVWTASSTSQCWHSIHIKT